MEEGGGRAGACRHRASVRRVRPWRARGGRNSPEIAARGREPNGPEPLQFQAMSRPRKRVQPPSSHCTDARHVTVRAHPLRSVSGTGGQGGNTVRAWATSAMGGNRRPRRGCAGHRRRSQAAGGGEGMDREAVHDARPRGRCGRYRPEPAGSELRPGDCLASQRSDCPVPSPPRFGPASSSCAAGMDSPCKGILFRARMAVMDSVWHAAVGGPVAGGRTMKRREARQTRSSATAWPGPIGLGPFSHRPAGATTVGSLHRCRKCPGDSPWHGAWMRAGRWLAGGQEGLAGANRVRRGDQKSENRETTIACRGLQALRDGSGRYRLARDNCCYREPTCQIRCLRPLARRPPGLDPAILSRAASRFNPLD